MLFVIICIILLGLISSKYSAKLLIDEVVNSKLLLINQIKSDIDREIINLEKLTFQLSLQPKIKAVLYATSEDHDNYQLDFYESTRTISTFKVSNNIISDIWIELFRSNVILNDSYKYNKDFFFGSIYKFKNEINWNIVRQKHPAFISVGKQSVTVGGKEKEVILFSRGITVDNLVPDGLVCINVDADFFNDILDNLNKENHSSTYVIDLEGNIVLSNPPISSQDPGYSLFDDFGISEEELKSNEGYLEKRINDKNFLVIYTTSQVSNWKYITVIPTEVITKKASNINGIANLAAMVCLTIGLIFSYMLTARLYYPISEMINYINAFKLKRRINDGNVSENELTFINRIITYIFNENENLKNLLNQNSIVLKEKLICDLLDGRINNSEFAISSEKIGLRFPYISFEVIVFEMENYSNYSKVDTNIDFKKEIFDIYNNDRYQDKIKIYYMRRGNDKVIILVNLNDNPESHELVYDFIKDVKDLFLDLYGLIFTIGVGNIYDKPEKISLSFIDALSALKYKVVKGAGSVIHIEELINIPDNMFEYSFETEKQIINLVKSGNKEAVNSLVDDIIRENIKENELSTELVENLFNSLASTAVRVIYDIRSSVSEIFGNKRNLYRELLQRNGIVAKREYILNIFNDIIVYINSKKQNKNDTIMTKVRDYIYQNYSYSQLSLTQVAEAVGLSPAYLSSIFKDISGGYRFVDYVNKIRVEESKHLLRTDLKILKIAEKVGFCSSNSFIKVFKKYEGITPGQFRETIGNSSNSQYVS